MNPAHIEFPKIARYFRDIIITEKLDGTNAQIQITRCTDEDFAHDYAPSSVYDRDDYLIVTDAQAVPYTMRAGSRNRWIKPNSAANKQADNFGFARWVWDNALDLLNLGEGTHYGEWWGQGVGRRYNMAEKRFSLFNTSRWLREPEEGGLPYQRVETLPACVDVVPILYVGPWEGMHVAIDGLKLAGSIAAPGFFNPEGVVIYHPASKTLFKHTFDGDGHKGTNPR